MKEEMIELLLLSFEGELSKEDNETLEKALLESSDLRKEKEEFLKMRSLVAKQDYSFNLGFSERVMKRLPEPDFSAFVIRMYKGITYSGVAAVILLLIMNYSSGGGFNLDSLLGLDEVSGDITNLTVMGH